MTDPYHGRNRREDLAAAGVRTANFAAIPGRIHPVDLSEAEADVVCTFPPAGYTTIEGATFGVIVTETHETHRLVFAVGDQTFEGDDSPDLSAFELGDPASDRKEFLQFTLIGGSWYVTTDGRRRLSAADIQSMIDAAIALIP